MTRIHPRSARWFLCCVLLLVPTLSSAGGLTFLQTETATEDPSTLAMSGDGTSVYSINIHTNTDTLTLWSRNPSNGDLTLVESYADVVQPTSVAVSPDGKNVYVTGRMNNDVTAFTRDLGTGELTVLQVRSDGDVGLPGVSASTMRRPSSVVVSPAPDEQHVYVAGDADSTISLFYRDLTPGPTYGELAYVGMLANNCPTVCGLKAPNAITIAPDGRRP